MTIAVRTQSDQNHAPKGFAMHSLADALATNAMLSEQAFAPLYYVRLANQCVAQ
jgi:hypothetical protein